MKLRYSPTSPFVRKVMIVAHETGLIDRIELITTKTGVTGADESLAEHNPLMKVPALVLDDGSTLVNSPVIAEYLDSLHEGRKLFPASGPARWIALQFLALGDGVAEANLLRRYEAMRPEDKRWDAQTGSQALKVRQGLETLDRLAVNLRDEPTIGEIAVACAVAYVDLRNPEEGWRARCPNLARWYESFAKRPSLVATQPV